MAEAAGHFIRRASLEVRAGAGEAGAAGGAFRFQHEAVTWAQETMLPALESVFSSLPPTEAHIVLDRLEITVEAQDPAEWGREVLPRLKEELRAVLLRKLREGGMSPGEKRESPAAGFFRKLAFYLEHGVLPWNLAAATPADLALQMETWMADPESPRHAPELAVLWRLPSARTRFLQALPAPRVARLISLCFRMPGYLAASWSRDAARLHRSPTALRPVPGESAPLPIPLLEEILIALSRSPRLFEHGLEEDIVAAYLARTLEAGEIPVQEFPGIPFESAAFQNSRQRLFRPPPSQPAARHPNDSPRHPEARPIPESPEGGLPTAVPVSQPADIASGPAVDGIHIPNAGLILLGPFLSLLLERLELSDKAMLKEPGTALALLHFLAAGEEGPAEFQLPLAKVLCGIPLEKAISLPMTLPDAMKDEARQMLASVIGHWGILKNTSVEGLRESFLKRPGKLTRTPRDWLLQVEQKAFDMLLQSLPWSFQIIRLPWMKQVIRTEWVA